MTIDDGRSRIEDNCHRTRRSMVTLATTCVFLIVACLFVWLASTHGATIRSYVHYLMLMGIIGLLFHWLWTARLLGLPTKEELWLYHDISSKMKHRLFSIATILTITAVLAALGYLWSPLLYTAAGAVPFTYVWFALRRYCPAAVLLLGRSSRQSYVLQSDLGKLPFLRAVSLLDVSGYNFDLNDPTRRVLNFDILRTRNEADWRSVVESLITVCPVIVIDVSEVTDAIQYEIARLADRNAEYKTVCVSKNDRSAPALDLADLSGVDVSEFALVPRHLLQRVVRHTVSRRSRLPTPEHSVCDILASFPVEHRDERD